MNAEQKHILRDALVATAVAAAPHSLLMASYKNAAVIAGFKLDVNEVLQHLDYLVEKEFLRKESEELSAGVSRWKATAKAVDYAEKNGLL